MSPSGTLVARELADERVEALGDDRSAGVDADDRERLGGVLFDDLVRDPNQGSAQVITVEYDFFVPRAPSWPHRTWLKEPTGRE